MIHAGTRSEHGAEVNGQDISLDDFDVFKAPEVHAQLRRQHAVQLDGNQAAGAFGQLFSQSGAPGTDLHHSLIGDIAQSVHDALGGVVVGEEVLSQFGAPARRSKI